MQILRKRRPGLRENSATLAVRMLILAASASFAAILAGCASPGSPMPPSLKLPEPVTDLSATRVGGQVVLHWTTPARTTDRVLITGPVRAEICRDAAGSTGPVQKPSRTGRAAACNVVQRIQVSPGASEAADTLSAAMTSGAPGMLAYRVQLLNASGRTAGPSAPVYAASGAVPEAVTGLRASSTKPGVVLEWAHAEQPGDSVELDRKLEQPAPGAVNPPKDTTKKPDNVLLGGGANATESKFSAKDTGGAIDRTAQPGATYQYRVQRVRSVTVSGKPVELRGEVSAPAELTVQAVFPPDAPTGLVAAPAFSPTGKPSIDLSWEPNVELHISGYKVYRRQGDSGWQLLTAEPVKVAAYSDMAVSSGQKYSYRVTAVNDAAVESQPSGETAETAPAAQ
jgi:hypothetical protein